MGGNHLVFLMLLQWTVIGGETCECNVEGVLHGRVELHACRRPQQNVKRVEWTKYKSSSPPRLLCTFEQPNDTSCFFNSCQNIQFIKENMSLIFVNLTKEDEGVYQNRIVFSNGHHSCNITLSVLSPPTALRVAVSSSDCTLTLRCEVRGQFLNLRWLRDGLLLPDDQRISISDRNMTVHVSKLNSSDWGTYTCRASNKDGTSEAHVNITDKHTTLCQDNVKNEKEEQDKDKEEKQLQQLQQFLIFAGLAVISTLLVCIILICICRKVLTGSCRRDSPNRRKENGYKEFISSQAETSEVEFLLHLYADFIKPKALQQAADEGQLAEDFTKVFYSTAE